MPIEEIARRVIRREPSPVQKKIMNLVRENQLIEGHALFAQRLGQVDHLGEGDVAIIVAVNEEDGRFPGVDGGDWGRLVREFGELGRNIFAVPVIGGPIVDAVEINAGGEDVGVAAEA